jgi:hypothetical protein
MNKTIKLDYGKTSEIQADVDVNYWNKTIFNKSSNIFKKTRENIPA